MKTIDQIPKAQIKAIFSDLDDTLTTDGEILPSTFAAWEKLKEKGYVMALVTGRPAGWADCLMRLWPLDAILFENGAGIMIKDDRKVEVISLASRAEAKEHKKVLETEFQKLQKKIPKLKLAKDQLYRVFDYAIDYAEEPPYLSEAEVKIVMEDLQKNPEITAKLSSIHVNYWWGKHTKVTAAEHWLATFGTQLGITKENVVYCGDSPNDEPLFAYFPLSMGVANVKKYLAKMKSHPQFVSENPQGLGFEELSRHLLK